MLQQIKAPQFYTDLRSPKTLLNLTMFAGGITMDYPRFIVSNQNENIRIYHERESRTEKSATLTRIIDSFSC